MEAESCDDGNIIGGDGCSATCIIETDFICQGGDDQFYDTCSESCGDGKRNPALVGTFPAAQLNQCDDWNIIAGDGCNITCYIETGW